MEKEKKEVEDKKQKITVREFFVNTMKILKIVYKTDKIYFIGIVLLLLIMVFFNYFFQGNLSNIINQIVAKKGIDQEFIRSFIIFSIAFIIPGILNTIVDMLSNLNYIK